MITKTHAWTLLCKILDSVLQESNNLQKANYSTSGAECVFEYKGEFYRVSVQHLHKDKL